MTENVLDNGMPISMVPVNSTASIAADSPELVTDTPDMPTKAAVVPVDPKRRGGRPKGSRNKKTRTMKVPVGKLDEVGKDKPMLGYYRISEDVPAPVWGSLGSACWDMHCYLRSDSVVKGYNSTNQEISRPVRANAPVPGVIINPFERLMVPTGLIFDIPEGYSVRAHPRSSTGYKQAMMLPNGEGIIDWDYTSQFYVLLFNLSNVRQLISTGDRIAQCELIPAFTQDRMDLLETTDMPQQKTDRSGGFGSTGK